MRKLKIGFTEYSARELVGLGGRVARAVAALPRFAGISPSPATIEDQTEAVQAKMIATGPGASVALRAAMTTLAHSFATLAVNLMATPGVTSSDLAQTEMPMAKTRERTTTAPDAPQDLRLKHGELSSEVLARVRAMPRQNIKMLEIQWALDPTNGPWTDGEPTTSSRGFKLTGLPRGKDIWVRVRARNVVGAGGWSDPATIMVI